MRVLVTRPQAESERTAAALRARGHEAVLAPLLRIEPVADAVIDPTSAIAILMTSGNAARAAAVHPALGAIRHLPVLAVGRQTAAGARAGGVLGGSYGGGGAPPPPPPGGEQLG